MQEKMHVVGLKSLKKFGSKSMPLLLVKEGQDKRQYVDKNIRDFYRNKKWMSISLWYV
jgi:hypothetical protein